MTRKSILVMGESCLDRFVYCDALRLAPDVPVPVLNTLHVVENVGMAYNVYNNIVSDYGLNKVYLKTNEDWGQSVKTRYVHEGTNHTFFRVDAHDQANHIDQISTGIVNHDIVVVSDYNKGYLSHRDIELICQLNDNVFLDTKKPLGEWARRARWIKVNDYEYNHSDRDFVRSYSQKIIHTDGANGCWFQGVQHLVDKVEVKDSSGAGDAFMAALVSEYARTDNILSAVKYANAKASQVVKHRGVTTI